MNKKQKREQDRMNRVFVQMNTGTRYHKNKKAYNRKNGKDICRKALLG